MALTKLPWRKLLLRRPQLGPQIKRIRGSIAAGRKKWSDTRKKWAAARQARRERFQVPFMLAFWRWGYLPLSQAAAELEYAFRNTGIDAFATQISPSRSPLMWHAYAMTCHMPIYARKPGKRWVDVFELDVHAPNRLLNVELTRFDSGKWSTSVRPEIWVRRDDLRRHARWLATQGAHMGMTQFRFRRRFSFLNRWRKLPIWKP